MTFRFAFLPGLLLVISLGSASVALAASNHQGSGGPAFRRDSASSIGQARQYFDRRQYESYSGDPGAQFQLRQKRQNLCRNVPEMC